MLVTAECTKVKLNPFMKNIKVLVQVSVLVSALIFSACSGSKVNVSVTIDGKGGRNTSTGNSGEAGSKAPNNVAERAVRSAIAYTGTKYQYGGCSKRGIDCSCLMYSAYQNAGLTLPRTSSAQSSYGKRVYIGELIPGDLVFFNMERAGVDHVGIWIENDTIIHCSGQVKIQSIDFPSGSSLRDHIIEIKSLKGILNE